MVAKITEHLFTIEINHFREKMFFMVISNYINPEKGLVNDLDTTYIRNLVNIYFSPTKLYGSSKAMRTLELVQPFFTSFEF